MERARLMREMKEFSLLMYRINRIAHQGGEVHAHPIPPAQVQTLLALKDRQVRNMSELAEFLSMPRQQLTRIMDALVDRELVVRRDDPGNRRVVLVEITDRGQAVLDEMFRHRTERIAQLLERMEDADAEKVLDALAVIKRAFLRLEEGGEP